MPTNPWISHVRQYVIDHGVSYKEALVGAKDTYKKKGPSAKAPSKSAATAAASAEKIKECESKLNKALRKIEGLTKPQRAQKKALKEIAKQSYIPSSFFKNTPAVDEFDWTGKKDPTPKMPTTYYVQ